jgi:hypothetical protein
MRTGAAAFAAAFASAFAAAFNEPRIRGNKIWHMSLREHITVAFTVSIVIGAAAVPAVAAAVAPGSPHAPAAPSAWRVVVVPSSVKPPATLADVSASGPANAWAVGADAETGLQQGTPLILHWNGTRWAKVALPGISGPGYLDSVSAASRSDAWALGSDAAGNLLLHWDGRRWRAAGFPGFAAAYPGAVAAGPGQSAWLVGSVSNTAAISPILVERWNGETWQKVATSLGRGQLDTVRVTPSGDVWVAGTDADDAPLIAYEHGGRWRALPTPPISAVNDVLGITPSDVWAAGNVFNIIAGIDAAYVCHWNGHSWTAVNVPADVLSADLSISPDQRGQPQWAGAQAGLYPSATLYAYYNGRRWSAVRGATDLSGTGDASMVTAHVPGTSATWAVGGSVDFPASGSPPATPVKPIIEFNPGTPPRRR